MKIVIPFISVVIPACNEEEYISRCLCSVVNLDYPSEQYEVIVVNNNSSDKTREIVGRDFPMVRLIDEPRQGVVFARICGTAEARGEIIAYTDADCTVPTDWLTRIAAAYTDPAVVAVGGTISYQETSLLSRQQLVGYWLDSRIYHVMTGQNMSFRTRAYHACGGFNEQVNLGEDHYISQQLKKVGRVVVLHGNAITTSLRRQRSTDWFIYMIKTVLFSFSMLVLHRPLRMSLKPMSTTRRLKHPFSGKG